MIQTSVLTYEADGVRMRGFVARDDERSGARPAVLIAPEAPGLDDYNRERCRRLAALGYVTLALDFHGDGAVLTDRTEMMQRIQGFMTEPLRIRRTCARRCASQGSGGLSRRPEYVASAGCEKYHGQGSGLQRR